MILVTLALGTFMGLQETGNLGWEVGPPAVNEMAGEFVENVLDVAASSTETTEWVERRSASGTGAGGSVSSVSQTPQVRVEYRPGCYESLVRAECDRETVRVREQCMDDFVVTYYTTLTFDLASGAVSSVYVPGYCPSDPETEGVTPQQVVVTVEDLQSLPLKGSGVFINPDETQVENYFVKLPINFYSDGSPQTLTTEVLGTQVLVEATPVVFQWDLGNGDVSPRVRDGRWVRHQGQRTQWFGWHQYTYVKSGFYTPSLTTQWSGRFSVDGGGSWRDIAGYAQTVESLPEVAVAESIPLLVRDSDAVWHKKTNP